MKKVFSAVLSLLLIFFLCGCAQNTAINTSQPAEQASPAKTASAAPAAAPNTITAAVLTEREELLASAMGDTFVFDYTVSETYKYVRLWIKAYTFGREAAEYADMLFETDPTGTMFFSLRGSYEEEPIQIILGAGSHSLTSGSRKTENSELPYIQNEGEYGQAAAVPSVTLPASGETALAYVRCSSGDFGNDIDGRFFADYSNQLSQIAGDNLTYVFGCTFYTERP